MTTQLDLLQHACLLTGAEESLHVLLHWYKSRGRTEGAWMVTIEGEIKPLTLTEAERIAADSEKPTHSGENL
jgi:hypothetical protein